MSVFLWTVNWRMSIPVLTNKPNKPNKPTAMTNLQSSEETTNLIDDRPGTFTDKQFYTCLAILIPLLAAEIIYAMFFFTR